MKRKTYTRILIAVMAAQTLAGTIPAPVLAAASSDPAAIVDSAESALAAAVSDSKNADKASETAEEGSTSNTEEAEKVTTIHIQTEADLREAAKACSLDTYSLDKLYVLDNDIALTDGNLQFASFGGTFDGQGHKITGLHLTGKRASAGLFREIQKGGVVKNLSVSGTVSVTGTQENTGGIAGVNAGTIRGCTFTGTVKGKNRVGGIAGSNTTTGILDNCSSKGELQGKTASGGLVGNNAGIIKNSTSQMKVNVQYSDTTTSIEDVSNTLENILMTGDVNSTENLSAVTDTGGIAGFNSGQILYCENSGTIGYEHVGYNTGGIAGRSSGLVRGCANSGSILGRKDVGGIIGQQQPYLAVEFAEDDLKKISDDLDDLSDLSDSLLNEVSGLSNTASNSASNLTSLTRDARNNLQTMTDQAQTDVNNAANDLGVAQNTLKNVNGLASSLSSQAASYADTLTSSLQATEQAFNAAVANATLTASERDSLKKAYQNLKSATASLSSAASALTSAAKSSSDTVTGRAKSLASAIEDLQSASNTVIQDYQDLQNKVKDLLNTDLSDLENQSQSAKDNAESAASAVSSAIEDAASNESSTESPAEDASTEEEASDAASSEDSSSTASSSEDAEAADTASSVSSDAAPAESGDVAEDLASAVEGLQDNVSDPAKALQNAVDNAANIAGSSAQDGLSTLQDEVNQILSQDGGLSDDAINKIRDQINGTGLDEDTKKQLLDQLDAASAGLDDLKKGSETVKSAISGIESDASTLGDNSAVIRTQVQKMLDDFDTIRTNIDSIASTLDNYADRIPDYANSELKAQVDALVNILANAPDFDSTIQEILTALDGISFSFDGVSSAVSQASGSLYSDLDAILSEIDSLNSSVTSTTDASVATMKQINTKSREIADILEDLYDRAVNGSDQSDIITDTSDISDADLEQYTTGRTSACTNTGTIDADNNVGGIVGTMGVEYDLDPEQDIQTVGSDSIDYSFLARAIVDNCTNLGEVTGRNNYTGGIAGQVSIGLITESGSSGAVSGTDYVGGTAGYSIGTIRNSYAKCDASGGKYVGGIAGYATTLTDCTSMVNVLDFTQYVGAIAGSVRELDKDKISGNVFVSDTLQGIDGVSYTGIAEPVTYEEVMSQSTVPKAFRQMVLTFRADDELIRSVRVSYGGSLQANQIPDIPEKDGFYGTWSKTDFTDITSDEVVTAQYERVVTLLPGDRQRGHVTFLFAEGSFRQGDTMHVAAVDAGDGEAERWQVTLPDDANTSHTFRFLAPGKTTDAKLYLVDESTGKKTLLDTDTMGEYLTFTADGTSFTFACELPTRFGGGLFAAAGGGAAVLVLLLLLLRRRKKRRAKARAAKAAATTETASTSSDEPEDAAEASDGETAEETPGESANKAADPGKAQEPSGDAANPSDSNDNENA